MDPVTGLSIGRIALGIGTLVSPGFMAKASGIEPAANPQLDYYARMFAAREIAVGGLTLVSSGSTRRNLTLIGMAIDASDSVTGALGLRGGQFGKVAGGGLAVIAAGAVLAGAVALVGNRGNGDA